MTTPSIEDGWSLLDEGRWGAARAVFTRLTDAGSPEAWEGLSWAAWWLDDAATVFGARDRAYEGFRAAGRARDAARMAIWLASDELDFHGAVPVAQGWLQRARRLLEDVPPAAEHGWLAFHEGYLHHALGDAVEARRRGRAAAALGRRCGVSDLEMLGLALEGAALVAEAQVRPGMRCLDEASAMALEGTAQNPISGAWTCCFLVTGSVSVLDLDRADAWTQRIGEFAQRYGSRYMLGFCLGEHGAVQLWRGRWGEAERLLTEAIEHLRCSRPAWADGPRLVLAELRRRQGRPHDAGALLAALAPSPEAHLCAGRLALDGGRPEEALDLAQRALRALPPQRLDRLPAEALLVRAAAAAGALGPARAACERLRELATRLDTPAAQTALAHAAGVLAAAAGDAATARASLEDAVDGFARIPAPYEAAQARLELAATLAGLGRRAAADREARAARRQLRALEDAAQPDAGLTARERDVAALLGDGLTNRQIAQRLVISEHTVHRHVANVLRKLDVPSRAAVAAEAARLGWRD